MSDFGVVFLVLVIAGILFSKITNGVGPRPGGAADSGKASENAAAKEEEDCDDPHQGEASHQSAEGFSASKQPLKKDEVHAINRATQTARAARGVKSAQLSSAPRMRLTAADARRAFVMSEILDRPVSMRDKNEP